MWRRLILLVLGPPVFLVTFAVVIVPLAILAALSVPYYLLYPERHAHFYDLHGSPAQRERVAKWRLLSSRLSFWQRIQRWHRSRKYRAARGERFWRRHRPETLPPHS